MFALAGKLQLYLCNPYFVLKIKQNKKFKINKIIIYQNT